MRPHLLYYLVTLVAVALSCSDSSDNPTPPDDRPSISVQDQTVVEGNTALVDVELDHSTDRRVIFSFATLGGTATSGSDYTATSGTDTIAVGQVRATILVSTLDDSDVETAETFSVALSAVSGAEVARALATCTITDNDVSQVSFATQIRPLLRTSCAKLGTCHGGAFPGGGMFLDTNATYTNVVSATGNLTGGPVVVVGNSATSTLYTKTTDSPPFGSRMPQGAAPLSLTQQALIRDWIDQGALDN